MSLFALSWHSGSDWLYVAVCMHTWLGGWMREESGALSLSLCPLSLCVCVCVRASVWECVQCAGKDKKAQSQPALFNSFIHAAFSLFFSLPPSLLFTSPSLFLFSLPLSEVLCKSASLK